MSMPETTVYENDGFVFFQYDVRAAGQSFLVYSVSVSM
jgi:hypothetical protein